MKVPTQTILAVATILPATLLQAATYNVPAGTTQTLSGVTESAATVKSGAGTLRIEGNNTFLRFQPQAGTTVFSGGTTSIGDSTATGVTAASAPWGQTDGETVVTDGATVKVTAGTYCIMDNGTLTIENGTFDASGISGHFMNAFESGKTSTGSKIVIGNGGILKAGPLRPSGDGANNASFKEKVGIDLNAGGELHIGQFWADQNANRYGRINFNGGVLYPQWGPTATQTTSFLFNDDTNAARRPWSQDQITPTILEGGAYIDLSKGANFVHKSFASGAEHDGGLHVRGTKILYWNAKNSTFNGGTWLESGSGAIFALDASKADDSAFGAVPASPATNIWITGSNHTIYNESGTFNIHSNRMVFVGDGCLLYTGTKGRLVFGGEIHGEVASGNVYPTGTAIYVKSGSDWNGAVVLDPGPGHTNDVGRLVDYGRLDITSGVTRITAATDSGTSENTALVFVCGNNSAYTASRGELFVNGGTLYAPTASGTRFVIAQKYANVSVSNGGNIDMSGVAYVNGYAYPATFSIEDGEARFANFQVANGITNYGNVPSIANFNTNGFLATKELWSRVSSLATLNFNGGGIRSWGQGVNLGSTDSAWDNVTLLVKEGGAKFDTESNLFVYRTLASGAAADGGMTKTGAGTLVFATNCTYNGATRIEGGSFQARVDETLLPGSTLVLANGAAANFCKYDKYVNNSYWTSTRTVQHLGRLEGNGRVSYSRYLHVDGAVAPSIGGSLKLQEQCDLQGDLEIRGDATGCGKLEALTEVTYAIDISNLRVKMVDPENFDKTAGPGFYKILEAPNGITGRFVEPADVPDGWHVKYAADGKSAYLYHNQPFVMVVR